MLISCEDTVVYNCHAIASKTCTLMFFDSWTIVGFICYSTYANLVLMNLKGLIIQYMMIF